MARTLPAEITNNKNNISNSIVLMLEVPALSFYVATQSYTLSLTAGGNRVFTDGLKFNGIGSFDTSISENVNNISNTGSLNISLTNFRGSVRSALLGSAPDLTGQTADLYFKLDTSSTAEADRLKIFSGQISEYTEQGDILQLKIKSANQFQELAVIPSQTLAELDSASQQTDDTIADPIQYGDFNFTEDPLFYQDFADAGSPAMAPFLKFDGTNYIFRVSNHLMDSMPTATNINNSDGDSYLFIRRQGIWLQVFSSAATVFNTGTGSSILIPQSNHSVYAFFTPTSTNSGNTGTNPANTYDGKVTTFGSADTTNDLKVEGFQSDIFTNTDLVLQSNVVQLYIYFKAYSSTVSPPTKISFRKISDDSLVDTEVSLLAASVTADTWTNVGFFDITGNNLSDLYVQVNGLQSDTVADIAGIMVRVQYKDFNPETDEQVAYVKCKGYEFSGTWGGRKTTGNPITHPVDMVESLLRDHYSITDINTTSFDDVAATMSGYKANFTMLKKWNADNLLNTICKQFNLALAIDGNNEFIISRPSAALNFTSSGTGTPNNTDIFNDTDSLTGNVYSQNPIKLNSFELKRTSKQSKIDKLKINYQRVWNNIFLNSTTSGTGDETVYNNIFLSDKATADLLVAAIQSWLSQQKSIAVLGTFINALHLQAGDIINIQHGDLNDAILNATVTTQKWLVRFLQFNLRNGLISLAAVEIL